MNLTRPIPASAMVSKSFSSSPGTSSSVPPYTLTPEGRRLSQQRLATTASETAHNGSGGSGSPGTWSSPAEMMEVTPPCM